ncbi:MAG TPA: hypothetical protein VMS55_18585 [Myxococcota bacterium]|nr:hypothetical protein [Myxococcota bacterium]
MSAAGCPFCVSRRRTPSGYRLAWTLLRLIALAVLVWYVAARFGGLGS